MSGSGIIGYDQDQKKPVEAEPTQDDEGPIHPPMRNKTPRSLLSKCSGYSPQNQATPNNDPLVGLAQTQTDATCIRCFCRRRDASSGGRGLSGARTRALLRHRLLLHHRRRGASSCSETGKNRRSKHMKTKTDTVCPGCGVTGPGRHGSGCQRQGQGLSAEVRQPCETTATPPHACFRLICVLFRTSVIGRHANSTP
eukprot:1220925-Rhodomonas_salina.2